MSESTTLSQQSDSFEGRMKILKQELELAILWQQSCILMVASSSEYVRAHSVSILENFLMGCIQNIVWIHTSESDVHSPVFWDQVLDSPSNTVFFFIDDLSNLAHQHELIEILNQHSYLFIEKNVRIVFWLAGNEATVMEHQVPALWERRNNFIELNPSPKPEQVLQNTLESVWQETDEHNDQFDDTKEKIFLHESFLTELPLNIESASTRANHLITLGVLHWRKGDYDHANDILEKALKIATKMQDAWLEAECFNALALVKSSIGKHEDAIKAYKQAITLAPNQIFAWNNLGNLCLAINRNHEALIDFQKAIEQNANDAIAWNGLGDVYSRSGYVDDAIAAYQKSIECAPLLPHPWNGLGNIYIKSGRSDEGENAFQKAITLNENFILPRLGLANLYAKQGRYRDASREYQHALLLEPHNSVIWNEFGCMCLDAEQYDDAIEALTKAIELNRSFGWAYSNLALAHASHGKAHDSIPLYLKSLELIRDDEQKSLTLNRLANSYRMLNNYDSAIKAYRMADTLNASNDLQPDLVSVADSDPLVERSEASPVKEQVFQQENNPEEESPYWIFQPSEPIEDSSNHLFQTSSRIISSKLSNVEAVTREIGGLSMQMTLPFIASEKYSSVAKTPKSGTNYDARMWNEKGNLLFRAGAFEEAIGAYNKAIQYDRCFGWSYTNLGIAYLHLGKYAEAVLLLQKSLELLESDKERAIAWNELGNLYRCLNDYHNAVAAYQRADELDPDHASARDTVEYLHIERTAGDARVWSELGDAFFKASSHAEAADCYLKATELEPLNGWAFSNLALSLSMQSKFEEAVSYYLKSIEVFKSDKEKAGAWNRLGNVYRRLNDYENAMASYQNAVKLNNGNNALLTRARFSLLGNCYVD